MVGKAGWGLGLGVIGVLALGCQLETVEPAVLEPVASLDAGPSPGADPVREQPAGTSPAAPPPAAPAPAPAPTPDPQPPAAAAEGSCRAPFVPDVCDPVCNTGCPPLSRCNVGNRPGEGVCIGMWIGGESDRCWRTERTDSCGSQLTCFSGRCRRLCYQDRDCTGTEKCCNIDLPSPGAEGEASSGFKGCGPCG